MFKIFQKEDIARRKKYIEDKKNELEYIYSTYNLEDDEFKEIISYFKLDDELEKEDFLEYLFNKNRTNLDRVNIKDVNEDELRVDVEVFFEDVKNRIEKGNKDKNEIAFDFRIDKFLRKKFENYIVSFSPENYIDEIKESVKKFQSLFIPIDSSVSLITNDQVEMITNVLSGEKKLNDLKEQEINDVKELLNILFTKSLIYKNFKKESEEILTDELINYYDRLYVLFNYHLEDEFLTDDFKHLKDKFKKILPKIHKKESKFIDSNEEFLKRIRVEDRLGILKNEIDRKNRMTEVKYFSSKLKRFERYYSDLRYEEAFERKSKLYNDEEEFKYIKNYAFYIIFDENISSKIKNELLFSIFISLIDFSVFGLKFEKWDSLCRQFKLNEDDLFLEKKAEFVYYSKKLGRYLLKKSSILKFETILNLEEREIDIFELRLEGNTLENIAKEFGLTKERIRQILNKIINKKHESKVRFKEDIYSILFKIYDYTEENFKELIRDMIDEEFLNEIIKFYMFDEELLEKIKKTHMIDEELLEKIKKTNIIDEKILEKIKKDFEIYEYCVNKYVNKVYKYLDTFYEKGKENKRGIYIKKGLLNFYDLPEIIINKTLEFDGKYSEEEIVKSINDEKILYLVENSKIGLLNYFVKEFAEENISYKYFKYILDNLKDYGYEMKNKDLNYEISRFSKNGTFDKNDIDECYYVLSSGNTFRYYNPYNKDVFENLIRILKLDCYTFRYDVKALYDDYKEVMEEYDIRNEKELLYILKKINNINDLNINFYHYTLWKGNRYRIDYLNLDLSSPEKNTLYNKQEIKEAINLFKNNYSTILDENVYLGSKLKDRYLDFYCEKLSKSQEEKEQLLNEEVNISDYVITKDVLKEVGYNVENGYVYSNKEYTNLEEALSSIFEKELKRVPVEKYDGTSEFYKILEKVKKSYGYICGATKSYLKSKGIKTDEIYGIIKNRLERFEKGIYISYEEFFEDESIKNLVTKIKEAIDGNEENEIKKCLLCQSESISVCNLKIKDNFYMLCYFGENKKIGINDFLNNIFYIEKVYVLPLFKIVSYLNKYVLIENADCILKRLDPYTIVKIQLRDTLKGIERLKSYVNTHLFYIDYDYYQQEK
ncbi:MAG: sigma factor-like helix-turn-helix DNA-binding protein [Streptobacillus sp.]